MKVVINDNGGSAQVEDFQLFIDEQQVISEEANSIDAGQHVVSEIQQAGYSATISGDCSEDGTITLNLGDNKTCTITNDDQQATLIVVKQVINDDGREKQASDFNIHVTGNNPDPADFAGSEQGTVVVLDAGEYDVSEDQVSDYTMSLGDGCSGILNPGDEVQCTITNDDTSITADLQVTKIGQSNANSGDTVEYNIQVHNNGPDTAQNAVLIDTIDTELVALSLSGEGCELVNPTTLQCDIGPMQPNADSFFDIFVEISLQSPSGSFTNTAAVTSDTFDPDEDNDSSSVVTTVSQTGTIIIVKDTVPDNEQDFEFSGSFDTFFLDDDGDDENELSNTQTFSDLQSGSYEVTELAADGFTLNSLICSDPDDGTEIEDATATIDLDEGETITCTYQNVEEGVEIVSTGTITIVKDAIPDSEQDFAFTGSLGAFSLDDDGDDENELSNQMTVIVDPGTYNVAEEPVPEGWNLANATCDDGSPVTAIQVSPSENVVCTFTNNELASVQTSSGSGIATFSVNNGGFESLPTPIDPQTLPAAPPDVTFPHGLFTFTISGLNPGDQATVTITFPSDPGSQYWKFQNGEYFQMPSELVVITGNQVILTLTDGGVGDADGEANGTIVDPGGPVVVPTGKGGGEGKFRGRGFAFGDPNSPSYDSSPPTFGQVLTMPGSLKVLAEIRDDVAVKDANLIVMKTDSDLYTTKTTYPMKRHDGNMMWWDGIIPSSDLYGYQSVSFRIVARDYNNNVGEYSASVDVPSGALTSVSTEGASFVMTPLTVGHQPDRTYSIVASGMNPGSTELKPQITIKNTGVEALQNIRLILSPELQDKFLLSDYAIKSIPPKSEITVSLKLNGKPNVDEMGHPIPYNGQVIITVNNRSPNVLQLSGNIPNESASLQALFMQTIASKTEQRYKSFEKPEQRISQAEYAVTLGSGESVIRNASDEVIITNTSDKALKNLRIMTSAIGNHFLPDQKNIEILPPGSFVKVKLVSKLNDAEISKDLNGELLIAPENGIPVAIPINIGKKIADDKNLLYEVRTLSGNEAISNTADGIVIRNNSGESIENVRIMLPRELTRIFSLTEDSFRSIEPNSEKIVSLQQRGTLDSKSKQILSDYVGEIVIVSSDGMKKIVPVNIVWKSISSEHFVVYARDNAVEMARATQVINFLERTHDETTKIIDESKTKTVIYMTSSIDELQTLSEVLAPSTFVFSEGAGFVWSDSEDVNILALRQFVYRTIIDEYSAYWTQQKISFDKGNWLVDGMSNYVTASIVGERGMIKDQLDTFVNEPVSFEWYGSATDAQYGATYTLFEFLVEKYGNSVIDKTLNNLGSTIVSNNECETFEQCALLKAVHDVDANTSKENHDLSFETIMQDWVDYVNEKYLGVS